MQKSELLIIRHIIALDVLTHGIVQGFPRSERHVLSADIRHTIAGIERLTIEAARVQLWEKKAGEPPAATLRVLRRLDVELEYFKLQMRKADELRYVSKQRCAVWSEAAAVIGRMLGGWLRDTTIAVSKRRTTTGRTYLG